MTSAWTLQSEIKTENINKTASDVSGMAPFEQCGWPLLKTQVITYKRWHGWSVFLI